MELVPTVHRSYHRHLLSDEGCVEMTHRMQAKLGIVDTPHTYTALYSF